MRNWRRAIHEIVPSTRCREAIFIVPHQRLQRLWHPWNHNKRQHILCFVFCCSTCKFYCCLLPLGSYPNFYDPKHRILARIYCLSSAQHKQLVLMGVVTKVQSSSININSINTFSNAHSQVSLFLLSWIVANTKLYDNTSTWQRGTLTFWSH